MTTHISIHPPPTGRDNPVDKGNWTYKISIHPPPTGRDGPICVFVLPGTYFNPPAPHGAGLKLLRIYRFRPDFNPPAPHGAGPYALDNDREQHLFQSTRPPRGGTAIV